MKKKKSKKWIIIFVIILIVVGGGLFACSKMANQAAVNLVETTLPETGDLEEIISVTGIVESEEVKNYYAPVTGKLQNVYVKKGDLVEKGDELIAYNMMDMERSLEQSRLQFVTGNSSYNGTMAKDKESLAELQEANTNLPILEQQIKDETAYIKKLQERIQDISTNTSNTYAARSLDIQKQIAQLQQDALANKDEIAELQSELSTNQYLSQTQSLTDEQKDLQKLIEQEQEKLAEYEEHRAEMETQKKSAEAAILTIYQKENLSASEQLNLMNYEKVQQDYEISKKGITAEFDGIITEVTAIEGMSVAENSPLLVLANTESLKVSFSVGKYDLAKIAVGQYVDIETNGHTYTGEITRIDRMATTSASGNVQVGAQVHINQPDDNIIIGLDAKLKIRANKAEGVLLVPVVALNADKDSDFVYVEENGIAVRRDVVTGISSTEQIEIKEGLSANDKVIVFSLGILEEGMQVVEMPAVQTQNMLGK